MIRSIRGYHPEISKSAFLFEHVSIYGNVSIAAHCSLYPGVVIRAEGADPVTIGPGTNLQEHVMLHTQEGYPITIGKNVTIGHGAILHGCSIADHVLVGMGAIIQNGVAIGKNCLIGAGAVLKEHMKVPENSMVYGVPARIVRPLREEEIAHIAEAAREYQVLIQAYRQGTATEPPANC